MRRAKVFRETGCLHLLPACSRTGKRFLAVPNISIMFVLDILFALMIAFLLAILYYCGRRGRAGRWATLSAFIIGLIFAGWLGGMWLAPGEFILWRIHWVPYAFLAVLLAIVSLILIRPPPSLQSRSADAITDPALRTDTFAVSIFFSLSALVFVALIGLRYA